MLRYLPALLLALPLAAYGAPAPFTAQAVSVADGDTLRVVNAAGQRTTIRLACIDAPEKRQGQPGADARAALISMTRGPLQIRPLRIDRYGRTVAEISADAGSVNLALVASGRAFVYHQYLRGCDRSAYLAAEQGAADRELGVWATPGIVRPWVFRRR